MKAPLVSGLYRHGGMHKKFNCDCEIVLGGHPSPLHRGKPISIRLVPSPLHREKPVSFRLVNTDISV